MTSTSTWDGWRKSSHSGGSGNGNCIMMKVTRTQTKLADSKNPGPELTFPVSAINSFLAAVKDDSDR